MNTLRTSDRADLVGYVPYVLGFHPTDCLVVMVMCGKRMALVCRIDANVPLSITVAEFCKGLGQIRGISGLFLFGYGPSHLIDAHARLVADQLERRNYPVWEALRVHDGAFHCLKCTDCTGDQGMSFDVSSTLGAVLGTYQGRVVLPDREAVVRQVRPIGGIAAVAMTQATDRAEDRLADLFANSPDPSAAIVKAGKQAINNALRGAAQGSTLDDDTAAWLVLMLHHLPCRDHAWIRTDRKDWQLQFWLDLTRRGEAGLIAPVATLLGWCAWRRGDGVLAEAALTRALAVEPAYSLALMLMDALDNGLPPSAANGMFRKFRRSGGRI